MAVQTPYPPSFFLERKEFLVGRRCVLRTSAKGLAIRITTAKDKETSIAGKTAKRQHGDKDERGTRLSPFRATLPWSCPKVGKYNAFLAQLLPPAPSQGKPVFELMIVLIKTTKYLNLELRGRSLMSTQNSKAKHLRGFLIRVLFVFGLHSFFIKKNPGSPRKELISCLFK